MILQLESLPLDTTAGFLLAAWVDDHRTKLIDFNTDGTVTVDGLAGDVTVELLDDETSAFISTSPATT